MKKQKGFTLLELLIVIGIIAILAAIIYTAVDPARRFAEARNANRWASVNSILNAVLRYTVDNGGKLPAALAGATNNIYYVIGTDISGCDNICTAQSTAATCLDLSTDVGGVYLASIPIDPAGGSWTAARTGYYLMKKGGILTVGACSPEAIGGVSPVISVSR